MTEKPLVIAWHLASQLTNSPVMLLNRHVMAFLGRGTEKVEPTCPSGWLPAGSAHPARGAPPPSARCRYQARTMNRCR